MANFTSMQAFESHTNTVPGLWARAKFLGPLDDFVDLTVENGVLFLLAMSRVPDLQLWVVQCINKCRQQPL